MRLLLALLTLTLPAAAQAAGTKCAKTETAQIILQYRGEEEKAEAIPGAVAALQGKVIAAAKAAKLGNPVLRSYRYSIDDQAVADTKDAKPHGYAYKGRASYDIDPKIAPAALLKALGDQQLRATLTRGASTGKGCATLAKGS